MRWRLDYSAPEIAKAIDWLWETARGDPAPHAPAARILAPGNVFSSVAQINGTVTLTVRNGTNPQQRSLQISASSVQREPANSPRTGRTTKEDILRESAMQALRAVEQMVILEAPDDETPQIVPARWRQSHESHDTFGSGVPDEGVGSERHTSEKDSNCIPAEPASNQGKRRP